VTVEPRPYAATAFPGASGSGWIAVTGGFAAVMAGLCWVGKGGAILVTGVQPPLLYEFKRFPRSRLRDRDHELVNVGSASAALRTQAGSGHW
jgi:hypothetical protein